MNRLYLPNMKYESQFSQMCVTLAALVTRPTDPPTATIVHCYWTGAVSVYALLSICTMYSLFFSFSLCQLSQAHWRPAARQDVKLFVDFYDSKMSRCRNLSWQLVNCRQKEKRLVVKKKISSGLQKSTRLVSTDRGPEEDMEQVGPWAWSLVLIMLSWWLSLLW